MTFGNVGSIGRRLYSHCQTKGLSRARVILIHALRNAMLPVVTVIGFTSWYDASRSDTDETIFHGQV